MKEAMTAGERMKARIYGEPVDRLPVVEWAPWWNLTTERWAKEGLKVEPWDVLGIQRHFGLDGCVQTCYGPYTELTPGPASHGAGIMKTPEDYAQLKKTMFRDPDKLLPAAHYEFLEKTRADGDVMHFFTVPGFFWYPRELFGIEPHLYSFYDYPELYEQICSEYADWLVKLFEYIFNTFRFDFMSFAEDMSYNNGPMLSKEMFDEFLAPCYRRLIPLLKQAKIPVFVDSDGDITKAVDWYYSVGADGMFPLERQAGVDVSLYIDKHPDMAFLGHFDKMCMKFGAKAMTDEFERLLPSMKRGRFIPSVDHQTPPDVSVENYEIYVRLLKRYAVLAVEK